MSALGDSGRWSRRARNTQTQHHRAGQVARQLQDLLPFLWIQVTEGDGVEGVVSSEEEPVAHIRETQ